MSTIFTANAYGKINLHLDVLDKMANGYHNVCSIMQSVSLCDIIKLEISDACSNENEIEIISSSITIPNDKTNIVYKCAKKFFDYTKIQGKRCAFNIDKRIPVSAGMAGGSTDGAAALKLLNEALCTNISYDELCKIGASVGADIPFCIAGGTCICQGIGEKITPIKSFSDVYLVSAIDSKSSVSTPTAFAMLDNLYGTNCTPSKDISLIVDAIEQHDTERVGSLLYNKFESVIIPSIKNVQKIKDIMVDCGAVGALMSGSGPSVFGIFLDENLQKKAYETLKNCSINAFLCKTV